MNEKDLEKLIDKQLNEPLKKVKESMCKFYQQYHEEIQSIITEQTYLNTNIVPRYQDLNWRLQIELANRSTPCIGNLANKTSDNISVLLRFKLRKLNTKEFDYILIKCDLNQLAMIQQTLDQAIKNVKLKKTWINAAFD